MAGALLTQHPLYRAPGQPGEECSKRYRELFRAHLDPELIEETRQATNGNYVLGGSRFCTDIEIMLRCRVTRGKAGRPTKD